VASIPLIASSIMSKKIAEGTEALVLDVKVGTGAFMTDLASARQLAETMVAIGEASGVKTRALLTDMSVPLGRAVGNALEVAESVACFRGDGPSDLVELTLALAREMLELVGLTVDPEPALTDGRALATWNASITAQGGDPAAALPEAPHRHVVRADRAGYVTRLDALAVGSAAWRLGAGRARQDDPVSFTAGVMCWAKPGDRVEPDQPLLELHVDDPDRLPQALQSLEGCITIGAEPPPHRPLILDRIG
jgi:thymidine phosphorylase